MFRYILIFLFTISIFIAYKLEYFYYPIDEIILTTKEKKYNQKNINSYVDSLYGQNLLTINIDEIQNNILSDAWIRDAEISKLFPSKLKINIIQHTPVAMYNSKVITSNGTIIEPSEHKNNNLPSLIDYSNDIKSASEILSISSNYLDDLELRVKKIEIYHSLIKIYASDILLITDKEKFEINLKRLTTSFNMIEETYGKKINSVDMRYSNGFAIK